MKMHGIVTRHSRSLVRRSTCLRSSLAEQGSNELCFRWETSRGDKPRRATPVLGSAGSGRRACALLSGDRQAEALLYIPPRGDEQFGRNSLAIAAGTVSVATITGVSEARWRVMGVSGSSKKHHHPHKYHSHGVLAFKCAIVELGGIQRRLGHTIPFHRMDRPAPPPGD